MFSPMPDTILAVDPSLRGTGLAVLERNGQKTACLHWDVIRNPAKVSQPACLVEIHERVRLVIERFAPTAMAIEGIIYVQSYQTAITLGSARGAVVLAAAQKGLSIYEYAPKRAKQAVVGRGGAQKTQVAFMVRALLGLTETPPADAADAIAIGLAHFQSAAAAAATKTPLRSL